MRTRARFSNARSPSSPKSSTPNLVRVLGQGREKGAPFFVTEFLAGGDVKNLVVWERREPLEPALALSITVQILRGLQALHDHGFIHRDLKPSNFLLDRPADQPGLKVKIADYGLAKSFETAGNSIFEYTKDGVVAGSYVYIPPEQITNYKFVQTAGGRVRRGHVPVLHAFRPVLRGFPRTGPRRKAPLPSPHPDRPGGKTRSRFWSASPTWTPGWPPWWTGPWSRKSKNDSRPPTNSARLWKTRPGGWACPCLPKPDFRS